MRLTRTLCAGLLAVMALVGACAGGGGMDFAGEAEAAPMVCAAEGYQVLVGQLAGEIDAASLPQPVRMVGHDTALDEDPVLTRMTLVTGTDGRIAEVVCN